MSPRRSGELAGAASTAKERREGVSKYEMRIIIRAYLDASGMQRSPPFFWHAPSCRPPFDRPFRLHPRLPFMAHNATTSLHSATPHYPIDWCMNIALITVMSLPTS